MRLNTIFILSVCAATAILASAPCHAYVVIDSFQTTQTSAGIVSGPGMIGGVRQVQSYTPTANINSTLPNQLLATNPSSVNWGTLELQYDGNGFIPNGYNTDGLGDVDLTQGGVNNGFLIDVTSAHGTGGTISISAL